MIVLMGVAGAGKSLQGRLFADEHGYSWISTGELFRVLVTGKRRQQMLEGKLLSDEEVIALGQRRRRDRPALRDAGDGPEILDVGRHEEPAVVEPDRRRGIGARRPSGRGFRYIPALDRSGRGDASGPDGRNASGMGADFDRGGL